jgi:hypothetical protein
MIQSVDGVLGEMDRMQKNEQGEPASETPFGKIRRA